MRALYMLLLVCASCAIPPPAPFDLAARSSVLVETPHGLGSGTVISDKCALTAAHVVDKETNIAIYDRIGKSIHIDYVYEDTALDLALVCADTSLSIPAVTIADTMPGLYAPVFMYGYPLGLNRVITTGLYEGENIVSAPAAPGNSGGGVFDAQGGLIGVLQAIGRHGEHVYPHLAYIADLDAIKPFLLQAQAFCAVSSNTCLAVHTRSFSEPVPRRVAASMRG